MSNLSQLVGFAHEQTCDIDVPLYQIIAFARSVECSKEFHGSEISNDIRRDHSDIVSSHDTCSSMKSWHSNPHSSLLKVSIHRVSRARTRAQKVLGSLTETFWTACITMPAVILTLHLTPVSFSQCIGVWSRVFYTNLLAIVQSGHTSHWNAELAAHGTGVQFKTHTTDVAVTLPAVLELWQWWTVCDVWGLTRNLDCCIVDWN